MDLQLISDFLSHFSWSELLSGLIGGGIVAVLNLWLGHCLAKRRDKQNRDGNEEIQRRAEARNERTRDDQRRDLENQREQKERLQAVKSYYAAYTLAFNRGEQGLDRFNALDTSTRIFRLEATSLDHNMDSQVTKILELMTELDKELKPMITSYGHRASEVMKRMKPLQEPLFKELMLWGLHGKSRKFGQLMENELAHLRSE